MTLPRRAFLASLLAAPLIPKFSLPKAEPKIEWTYSYPKPHGWIFIKAVSVSDVDGLISATEFNRDGTIKSHWERGEA